MRVFSRQRLGIAATTPSRLSGRGRFAEVPCEIISTRGALFALWGRPTVEDIDRVRAALQVAADECGHPVVYLTRLPPNSPPPDGAARARLDELMPGIGSVCSSYHVVLEGDGFGAALKRGILTGLFQLSWRRKTFFVHASVNDVARNVGPEQQAAVARILGLAAGRGLLTGAMSDSLPPLKSSARRVP
jgi:hypothetical protein